ncbi:MAG TPA: membrane protein insertion efficiency factor YidD [Actinomycetota bacterium]|nr:membrane protein insertion efficiency factor YidD [Actinomycetota bacterium]
MGWPVRATLLLGIRVYRLTLGPVLGGQCRFHPSCSAYAEEAIRELGWARGGALAAWRVLRCSPLSRGGVDYPPRRGDRGGYDKVIHPTGPRAVGGR